VESLKLDNRSMYQHAHDMILQFIEQNRNKIEKLPSEQEFSKMMGVSRNTVREAIRILEQEGVLYSRHGVGTFIISQNGKLNTCISILESATKIISDHGYTPGTLSAHTEVFPADKRIAELLGIEEGQKVFYIERVRTADDEPVVFVQDYIKYQEGMEEEYAQEPHESLLSFLKDNYDFMIGHVVCGIRAAISDSNIQEKLHLSSMSALLHLEQSHYNNKGELIFYSDSYFLNDKFNFNVIRKKV